MLTGSFFLSQGQDYDLHFTRTVPSQLDADRINRNLSALTRWPQWFFTLEKVTPVSHTGPLSKGTHLILEMDPHKGAHRRFNLEVEVTEFIPNRYLSFALVSDSSQKLTRLFSSVTWTLELLPSLTGANSTTLIQGTSTAHTQNWRSRLFGKIAERILMNQVFFPNLVKLAELRQPFSISPGHPEGGLTGPEPSQQ